MTRPHWNPAMPYGEHADNEAAWEKQTDAWGPTTKGTDMTTNEKIEANADLVMWCVHILGPDDVMAAPCHDAAFVHARELNKAVHGRPNSPDDVLCFAYPAPWPHSAEAHAESLKNWLKG